MSNFGLAISIGMPLGIFGFLFIFWKRLKDDYTESQIFSFAFLIAFLIIFGVIVGSFIRHGFWFWACIVLITIGFLYSFLYRKRTGEFKLNFFETVEAVGLASLFWLFSVLFLIALFALNIKLALFSVLIGILIPVFYFIDSRYRSFSWYKSGKVGFAGLAVLGIFFAVRVLVALVDPSMLSFVGRFEAILDSILALVFFAALYNLSGHV